jgi:hypothetical protein
VLSIASTFPPGAIKWFFLVLLAAFLAGCSLFGKPKSDSSLVAGAAAEPDYISKTEALFKDLADSPLDDFNLVRADIPPILVAAQKAPYALPRDLSCEALSSEVKAIDALVGADMDAPAPPEKETVELCIDFVGDKAMGLARSYVEGLVPFRSWVRKLTGAESYSKEVAAAMAAAKARRAFLKGLGQAGGCPPPAAPRGALLVKPGK